MFSRSSSNNSSKAPPPPTRSVAPSIISEGSKVQGDFSSPGDIQVDGTIEGNVRCQSVVVGEHGAVHGEVAVERADIHGTVIGQISAEEVTLARSARIEGDVRHKVISIEAGARIHGRCIPVDANVNSGDALSLPRSSEAETLEVKDSEAEQLVV